LKGSVRRFCSKFSIMDGIAGKYPQRGEERHIWGQQFDLEIFLQGKV